jgi:Putative auto-transporter adhesin, head GIN domain
MKQIILLTTLCIYFSCSITSCMAQRNEISTADRKIEDYNTLNISGGFDKCTLVEGEPGVKIIAEDRYLPYIETKNEGNALGISIKRGAPKMITASLQVSYRSLKEINNSGSTDIELQGTLNTKSLDLNYSGSGDFVGSIDVNELEVNMSGSSDFTLSGRADKQTYAISGSGDVHANNLKGRDAEVAISGSGDVDLSINGNIETSSSGSGRVRNRN